MEEELRSRTVQSERIEKRSGNLCLMTLLLRHGPQLLKCGELLHFFGGTLSNKHVSPRDVSVLGCEPIVTGRVLFLVADVGQLSCLSRKYLAFLVNH